MTNSSFIGTIHHLFFFKEAQCFRSRLWFCCRAKYLLNHLD